MSGQADVKPLFPNFEKFIIDNDMLSKAKGNLAAKLPRILGQGKTKADGLNLPPSTIERKIELVSLNLLNDPELPASVREEIEKTRQELEVELRKLKTNEGVRILATHVLRRLSAPTGFKDNHFFAGRLVLTYEKQSLSWSWGITPHYAIISKIPPDIDYLDQAYAAADKLINEITLPADVFEKRLELAWLMARHFSCRDDVLVINVARAFKVAAQSEKFWKSPQRRFFLDFPEATFIANLLNWRNQKDRRDSNFEFVPATLQQTRGPKSNVYYIPMNPEGTQVRPVIYLRKLNKSKEFHSSGNE